MQFLIIIIISLVLTVVTIYILDNKVSFTKKPLYKAVIDVLVLFFYIGLFLLIIPSIFQTSSCYFEGGKYVYMSSSRKYCKFPDQGKVCYSSDECTKYCVVNTSEVDLNDIAGTCNNFMYFSVGCSSPIEKVKEAISTGDSPIKYSRCIDLSY